MANSRKTIKPNAKTTAKKTGSCAKTKSNCCTEYAQENCALTDFDIVSDVLSTQKGLIV